MAPKKHHKDISGLGELGAAKEPEPKGNNFLLAIGIDDYEHCPKLFNCVKDTGELVDLLIDKYQFDKKHISTLFNKEATKANIYKAFRKIASIVSSDDNLLIYFSGHGEYDKIFKQGYWIPVEAGKGKTEQYIPNSEIRTFLSAINSRHTFLMADSCFSGSLFAKSVGKNVSKRYEQDPSRWGLTSGRNEIVADGQPGDNSPFAESLLYRLRNNTGAIGVQELCAHVVEYVQSNAEQTPIGEPLKVEGHKNGQFVFHLKKDEAADWKEAKAMGSLLAFQNFLKVYPDGRYKEEAKQQIKSIKARESWQKIESLSEESEYDVRKKIRHINNYLSSFPAAFNLQEAERVGELLGYKEEFLESVNNLFALRRLARRDTPFKAEVQTRIGELEAQLRQEDAEAEKKRQKETQKREAAERKQREKEAKEKAEAEQKARKEKARKQKEAEAALRKQKEETATRKAAEKQAREEKRKRRKERARGFFVKEQAEKPPGKQKVVISRTTTSSAKPSFFKKNWKWFLLLLLVPFMGWLISKFAGNFKSDPFIYEMMTDARDGQEYRVLKMKDGKYWMVDNLNYKMDSSWCYDEKESNCKKYGRLYTWEAAQTACPKGWYLPSDEEWTVMISNYNSEKSKKNTTVKERKKATYKSLIKRGSSGFSALLGGNRSTIGNFHLLNNGGFFWTSTAFSKFESKSIVFHGGEMQIDPKLNYDYWFPTWAYSCRCVKGDILTKTTNVKPSGKEIPPKADDTETKAEKAKTDSKAPALNMSYKWGKDEILVTIKGGVIPYHLQLQKDGREKYTLKPKKEGQYTFEIKSAYRKDPGLYTLILDDAKGNQEKRTLTIDPAEYKIEYGTLRDTRDGQSYKTVKLKDGKVWMAENLNFYINDSWCYDGKKSNCDKYGRLYTWEAAKKACPRGWHLPSDKEWKAMANYYGGYDGGPVKAGKAPYIALMSGGNSGFDALLGGRRYPDEKLYGLGSYGCFWTSTEFKLSRSWSFRFKDSDQNFLRINTPKDWAYSCRCVQD